MWVSPAGHGKATGLKDYEDNQHGTIYERSVHCEACSPVQQIFFHNLSCHWGLGVTKWTELRSPYIWRAHSLIGKWDTQSGLFSAIWFGQFSLGVLFLNCNKIHIMWNLPSQCFFFQCWELNPESGAHSRQALYHLEPCPQTCLMCFATLVFEHRAYTLSHSTNSFLGWVLSR
jgi:hypothetical protein